MRPHSQGSSLLHWKKSNKPTLRLINAKSIHQNPFLNVNFCVIYSQMNAIRGVQVWHAPPVLPCCDDATWRSALESRSHCSNDSPWAAAATALLIQNIVDCQDFESKVRVGEKIKDSPEKIYLWCQVGVISIHQMEWPLEEMRIEAEWAPQTVWRIRGVFTRRKISGLEFLLYCVAG